MERLKRHIAPGGMFYVVGMEPLPDHPGECPNLVFLSIPPAVHEFVWEASLHAASSSSEDLVRFFLVPPRPLEYFTCMKHGSMHLRRNGVDRIFSNPVSFISINYYVKLKTKPWGGGFEKIMAIFFYIFIAR